MTRPTSRNTTCKVTEQQGNKDVTYNFPHVFPAHSMEKPPFCADLPPKLSSFLVAQIQQGSGNLSQRFRFTLTRHHHTAAADLSAEHP